MTTKKAEAKPEPAIVRMTLAEARADLGTLLSRVAFGRERLIITRYGKDLMACISVHDLTQLEMLEKFEHDMAGKGRNGTKGKSK